MYINIYIYIIYIFIYTLIDTHKSHKNTRPNVSIHMNCDELVNMALLGYAKKTPRKCLQSLSLHVCGGILPAYG